MASPPPGWYDDPARSGRLRYWDGAAWTEHLTDPMPVLPQPDPEQVDGAVHGATAARPYDAAAERSASGQEASGRDQENAFWPFGGQQPTPTRPLQQVPSAGAQGSAGTRTGDGSGGVGIDGASPVSAAHDAAAHNRETDGADDAPPADAAARETSPPGQVASAWARGQAGPARPLPQEQPLTQHQQQPPPHRQHHQQQPPPHRLPQPAARPVAGPRAADGALLAPWWRRFLAWALDAAVVVAVSILPASFIMATRIDQLEVYSRSVEAAASGGGTLPAVPEGLAGAIAACTVVTALLYFLYEVFGLSRFGTTLGRRVLGIRVRVPGEPGHPSFEAASRRAGVKVAGQLAGGVPVLATLGMLFTIADLARGAVDRGRRTLHDLAGATEVVLVVAPSRPQSPAAQPPSATPQEHRSA